MRPRNVLRISKLLANVLVPREGLHQVTVDPHVRGRRPCLDHRSLLQQEPVIVHRVLVGPERPGVGPVKVRIAALGSELDVEP